MVLRPRNKAQEKEAPTSRNIPREGAGDSTAPARALSPRKPSPVRSQRRVLLTLRARRIFKGIRQFVRFSLAFGLIVTMLFGVAATGVGLYYYQKVAVELPNVNILRKNKPSLVTRVFDQSGSLLREFYVERRFLVTLDQIPDVVIRAILATEDVRFEEHSGVDLIAIIRAAARNILDWGVVQGGSTITQQLAKSLFLNPERTIDRKIREAILAVRIERTFSKRKILNLYLNQIYFGDGAYGIEAAARVYFGKNAEALTLPEAALLAGLPKAPSAYNPFKFYRRALRRRAHVLRRMIEENFITPEEWARAEVTPIRLANKLPARGKSDYAVEFVRKRVERKFGAAKLYRGGLKVHTTIRRGVQRDTVAAIRRGIVEVDRRRGYRGPVGLVDLRWSPERIWRAVEQLMGERGNMREFREGRWMPALVYELKSDVARLHLKRGEAILHIENAEWARPFDPRQNGKGLVLDKFQDILRRGDIILVERLEREKAGDSPGNEPVAVALVQEPDVQAAAVVTEPATGAIRAITGGYDFERSQFNRAFQAVRPPGSAFKPVVYSAAISEGWTPSDIIMDTPIIFPRNGQQDFWVPTNFENKFYGPTTLREGLARSRNVITVKLANSVGVSKIIKRAQELGIRSPLKRNLSIALGSSGVTLLELTSLYATLANRGRRLEPHVITYIQDSDGKTVWSTVPSVTQAVPPEEAYIILSLLENVVQFGTAVKAKALNRALAGKTGTTNDYQDAWFVGVSPQYSTGVWVGMDDKSSLGRNETGGNAALPIWMNITESIHEGLPRSKFKRPVKVKMITINPQTGLRVSRGTKGSVRQAFISGSEPSSFSTVLRKKTKGPLNSFKHDTGTGEESDGIFSKPSSEIGDISNTMPTRSNSKSRLGFGRQGRGLIAPAFDPFRPESGNR